MNDVIKSGPFEFRVDLNWAKLPKGWEFNDVADLAVDTGDRVIVYSRSEHKVIIFDIDGNFLSTWDEDTFVRPHGITIGPDGFLYCTDDRDHVVKKFTPEGKLLLTLGTPGKSSNPLSGEPFNMPTKVALEPGTGNMYISDGYGNARIHKFSPKGEHLFSWGQSGVGEGEFNFPHSVCTDKKGLVYVADRENHRVQIFDDKGKYVTQWNNLHRPCGLYITPGDPQLAVIGQLPTGLSVNVEFPNLGACVTIHDLTGKQLARFGGPFPAEGAVDNFHAPHGIAMDSHGDFYIGEVAYTYYGSRQNPPVKPRCLRKLIRIS